jgi:phosphoglycolate phosphatase
MIRCVVFDFDGTLVHSNEIKRRGFFEILVGNPDGMSRMAEILDHPPGDRTAIIAQYASDVGTDAESLITKYTRWVAVEILKCPLRDGAEEILKFLSQRNLTIHVNSATPRDHLVPAIEGLFGRDIFDSIHGGHGKKLENLRTIVATGGVAPEDVAIVGDGIDDWECAAEVGANFVGVGGGTFVAAFPEAQAIHDLRDLEDLLSLPGVAKA